MSLNMTKNDEGCRELGLQTRDPSNPPLSSLLHFYGNKIEANTFLQEKKTKPKAQLMKTGV